MEPVGKDPRWTIFGELHTKLEELFPRVCVCPFLWLACITVSPMPTDFNRRGFLSLRTLEGLVPFSKEPRELCGQGTARIRYSSRRFDPQHPCTTVAVPIADYFFFDPLLCGAVLAGLQKPFGA